MHRLATTGDDDEEGAKSKKREPIREPRKLHLAHRRGRSTTDASPTRRAEVLIVEDDPDCREILHDILVHAGYAVSTSVDRAEALELLRRRRKPTLIIMDLMMPNIDPSSFQSQLAGLELDDVPIVAISAATEREVPTPKGTRARFLKPIDLSRLLAVVNQIVADQEGD